MFETIIPAPDLAFLPFLLPALIGGVASVAGTVINNKNQKKQAAANNAAAAEQSDKQYAYSKEAAEQQYKYDMEAMALQRAWDLEDREDAKKNPTVIKSEIDFEAMRASAEKAGFNPLTVLRNGGGAGFTASSQPSAPLSRTAPTRQAVARHAALEQTAVGSSPVGAAIGGFLDNFDPFQDQKRELEYGLVQAQIANLNASTAAMNRPQSFNVPTYTAGKGERRLSGASGILSLPASAPLPMSAGRSLTPQVQAPDVTNPWPTSWGIDVNPNMPNAEMYEDRYGEMGGSVIGTLMNIPGDVIHNAPQLWEWGKSKLRNLPPPPLPKWLK